MLYVGGICKGPIGDVIEQLISKTGHSITWREVPWARLLEEAKNGTVDILPRHSMDKEREAFLHAMLLGHRERHVYFYANRHTNKVSVKSFDDLKNYTIGALRSSFYFDEFNHSKEINKWEVTEPEQLMRMLEAGRLDLVITSDVHRLDLFENHPGFSRVDFVKSIFHGRYISIPKNSVKAKYFKQLEGILLKMRKDGTIDKIFSEHQLPAPVQLF